MSFVPRGQPCFLFQRKFTVLQERTLCIPFETTQAAMPVCPGVSPLAKAGSSASQLQVFADSQMFLQFLGLSSESLVARSLPG